MEFANCFPLFGVSGTWVSLLPSFVLSHDAALCVWIASMFGKICVWSFQAKMFEQEVTGVAARARAYYAIVISRGIHVHFYCWVHLL